MGAAMRTAPPPPAITDFADLRRREFARLDATGHAYLDYTGSGLYPRTLVDRHREFLAGAVLGNPHSENPTSRASSELVRRARSRILEFFGADPAIYTVCFTANASGALRLVGEAYPFRAGSTFVLTADNHNSVNGIARYAGARGARVVRLPLDDELRVPALDALPAVASRGPPCLFAFPAQSNFSGVRHPLAWIREARARGWDVLLDAAAFAPTSRLSLDDARPDFACISFYKMFGYPTGIGALIARRDALARLRRPWFAGGTVEYVSPVAGTHLLKAGPEAFEDGTIDFLGMPAVVDGLDFLDGVGMDAIASHVSALTAKLLAALARMRHACGAPLVRVYGPRGGGARGGTVAFNVLAADGRVVPYPVIERAAATAGVSIRGGCFCNPGASESAFAFPADRAGACFERVTADGFTIERLAACLDVAAVGAVRASMGLASNERDLARLTAVLARFRELPVRRAPIRDTRSAPDILA